MHWDALGGVCCDTQRALPVQVEDSPKQCLELGENCCNAQSASSLLEIKERLTRNPVDQYVIGERSSASGPDQHASQSSASPPHHRSSLSGQAKEERYFNLPSISSEYKLDTSTVEHSPGFGPALKKYIHKQTGVPRAVLAIRKDLIPSDVTVDQARKHLETLCKLDHPNIVSFRECFEDSRHLKLVYDWCEGGPLMLQLWRFQGTLTEFTVAQVFRELLAALSVARSFHVNHLDLGLLCLFLPMPDRLSPMKVFGFGLAGFLIQAVTVRKTSKTNKHFYASPELHRRSVKTMTSAMKHACDIWSVGAMLFTFCSGRPPFGLGAAREIATRILRGVWEFGAEFTEYSTALKDLIQLLLTADWKHRIDADTALKQAWLARRLEQQLHGTNNIGRSVFSNLNSFTSEDHVKQTLARLLTDLGITNDSYKDLEEKFRALDLNGDGTLQIRELMTAMSKIPGLSPKCVELIVKRFDRNGNGRIDISEFIGALVMEMDEMDEPLIRKAFNKIDLNGDARITKKELFGVLRQYSDTLDTDEVSKFVGDMDEDGDEKMDLREFTGLFPGVKDKYEDLNDRMQHAQTTIQAGLTCLADFEKAVKVWVHQLQHHQHAFEIGCGEKKLPERGGHHTYVHNQMPEFEVVHMVEGLVQTLQNVPGYSRCSLQCRDKKPSTRDLGREVIMQSVGARDPKEQPEMLGLQLLATKDEDSVPRITYGAWKRPTGKKQADVCVCGNLLRSEEKKCRKCGKARPSKPAYEDDAVDTETRLATRYWIASLAADRQHRMQARGYRKETQVYESLLWLMKIKSEFQWQKPVYDCIEELRGVCIFREHEIQTPSRLELIRLTSCLTERLELYDSIDTPHFKVPKGARLLPMRSLRHWDLHRANVFNAINKLALPVELTFAILKQEFNLPSTIDHMRSTYLDKMRWLGSYINGIVRSIEEFLNETREDLQMSSTMESLMPSPPPVSHLYLKHSMGREIQKDAATPRHSFMESSLLESKEEDRPNHPRASQGDLQCQSFIGNDSVTSDLMRMSQSMSGNIVMTKTQSAQRTSVTENSDDRIARRTEVGGGKRNKIERNRVLKHTPMTDVSKQTEKVYAKLMNLSSGAATSVVPSASAARVRLRAEAPAPAQGARSSTPLHPLQSIAQEAHVSHNIMVASGTLFCSKCGAVGTDRSRHWKNKCNEKPLTAAHQSAINAWQLQAQTWEAWVQENIVSKPDAVQDEGWLSLLAPSPR